MSAVCTCAAPVVKISEHGEKYCKRCGYWWMPEHGSRTPGMPLPMHKSRHSGTLPIMAVMALSARPQRDFPIVAAAPKPTHPHAGENHADMLTRHRKHAASKSKRRAARKSRTTNRKKR